MIGKTQLWEMSPEEIQDYYAKNSPKFEPPGINFFDFVEGSLVEFRDKDRIIIVKK